MSWIDWCIVLILNGAGIVWGVYLARGTRESGDWFLGKRALPFWMVGISMFATNVDNADLTSVTGQTYSEGFHIVSVYAIGSAVGGILAAFFVVPAMYRAGYYTNNEFLEARFSPAARIISALIQIQYRSSMLGLIIFSMYLMLTSFLEMPPGLAWTLIVAAVVCSGLYTAWGGLRAVVGTDAWQGIIMMVGAGVIYLAVSQQVGGWEGMKKKLAGKESMSTSSPNENGSIPLSQLHRISSYRGDHGNTSPWVVLIGWTIVAGGYWTVNHTQTMRLMGSRSLWDMKMAAVVGVALSLPIMMVSASLGLFGRALDLEIPSANELYPQLAKTYLTTGMKGLVVAAMVAAVISTFDSMGSALSAVFTRDVYARLIAPRRSDAHYVWVSRIATVAVLALGFAYLPFVMSHKTMLQAFTSLISVFATPLFTVYLAGVFTRAHRQSGVVGLAVGSAYGVAALLCREMSLGQDQLGWLTGRWPAFLWSFSITSTTIAVYTLLRGPVERGPELKLNETGWLDRSRQELPPLREHPFADRVPWVLHPTIWATLLVIGCAVVVAWFW